MTLTDEQEALVRRVYSLSCQSRHSLQHRLGRLGGKEDKLQLVMAVLEKEGLGTAVARERPRRERGSILRAIRDARGNGASHRVLLDILEDVLALIPEPTTAKPPIPQ